MGRKRKGKAKKKESEVVVVPDVPVDGEGERIVYLWECSSDEEEVKSEEKVGDEKKNDDVSNDTNEEEDIRERKRKRNRKRANRRKEKQDESLKSVYEEAEKTSWGEKRDREAKVLGSRLRLRGLREVDVPADGSCLYNSIAKNMSSTVKEMRWLCSKELREHPDMYRPYVDGGSDMSEEWGKYCDEVETGNGWGGQVEIAALSRATQRSVEVYMADVRGEQNPLIIGEGEPPIRVAFRKFVYRLGEHYNAVMHV